jgi:hypothetical protein
MGALLEIVSAFLIFVGGTTGVIGDFSSANEIAYVTNDSAKMQQWLEQINTYCAQNVNGAPCTDASGNVLATGNMPNALAGYWNFIPKENKTGQPFTLNVTAGTACVSIDGPATFEGQYIPASIPVLDPTTGALTTKAATTNYYLHADQTKHGVFATTAATSTPGTC